jgi:pilus assembly protein CpaF
VSRLAPEHVAPRASVPPLVDAPGVDEIMVNGSGPGHPVGVERAGVLEATGVAFADEAELRHAIERILAPVGRRVDDAEPLADARLPDGSRVNVVIPPLALDGPALTIRRFRRHGLSPQDLVDLGTWPAALHDLLAAAVRARLTILVSGGTGSGKTTTLNALSAFVPAGERIVTIDDTAELRLQQPHVVRLEARPPSVEGRGEVTIRRLVRNALRMRPDRIVVGEVRGAGTAAVITPVLSRHATAQTRKGALVIHTLCFTYEAVWRAPREPTKPRRKPLSNDPKKPHPDHPDHLDHPPHPDKPKPKPKPDDGRTYG